MRCISPHGRYSIQVFEGNEQVGVDQRGVMHSVQLSQPEVANFEQGGLTEWEVEAALTSFNFSGLPEGVNPLTRVSVFDTEAYVQKIADEDKRELMLQKLDERLRHLQKQNPSEFVIVDKPAASRPWPSYDEDSVQDIIAFQKRLGISPEAIRLYEHENQARPEVIEAMTAIEEGRAEVEVEESIEVNA